MTLEPQLNKTEVWIAEHAIRILLAFAVVIALGGYFVYKTVEQTGQTSSTVRRIQPQVTKINRAICDERSLESQGRALRCAERIRVGLINCRRVEPCRAAFLAVATSPPPARGGHDTSSGSAGDSGGGDAHQQPSNHGSQQPGPGSQPGQPEAAPTPSPSPGAEPSPKPETPANGPQGAPGGGSASGAGVEVCALKTCVEAEVGLGL